MACEFNSIKYHFVIIKLSIAKKQLGQFKNKKMLRITKQVLLNNMFHRDVETSYHFDLVPLQCRAILEDFVPPIG